MCIEYLCYNGDYTLENQNKLLDKAKEVLNEDVHPS